MSKPDFIIDVFNDGELYFDVILDYATDTGATYCATSQRGGWEFTGNGHDPEDIQEELQEHMEQVQYEMEAEASQIADVKNIPYRA